MRRSLPGCTDIRAARRQSWLYGIAWTLLAVIVGLGGGAQFAARRTEQVGEVVDTFGGHDVPSQQGAVASFLGGGDEGVQRRVRIGPVRITRFPGVPALGASVFVAQRLARDNRVVGTLKQPRGECQCAG